MKRALLLLPLAFFGCDGDQARPPTTSIEVAKRAGALTVDGIGSGSVQLTGMSVMGLPSYSTFAYVESVGDSFMLVPATGLAANSTVLVDAPDGRQWTRQGIPNQIYLAAPFFSIDPVSGDDENACSGASMAAADAVPCKTLAEVNRRLIGSDLAGTVVFHLLADVPSTDSTVMTNVKSYHGTGYPIFVGKKTQVGSDYIVSAYATHVPASNTGYLLSATGIGAGGNLGHLISNAAEDKWAFIQSAPTGNQVRLTQPNSWDNVAFFGSLTASFTVGETVRVWTLPVLQQYPWTADVVYPAADQVEIRGLFSTPPDPTVGVLGSSSPFVAHSIINGVVWQGGVQGSFIGILFSGTSSNLSNVQGTPFVASGIHETDLLITDSLPVFSQGFDIQAGGLLLSTETDAFSNDPTSYFSIFDCLIGHGTGAAIYGNSRSSLSVYNSNTAMYGSGNTAVIYQMVGPGSQGALSKTASTVMTSAPYPISLAGVPYNFSQIPITDAVSLSGIAD